MPKPKKEITNNDLFGLINKLDSKIDSRISSVEKNLGDKIKANTDSINDIGNKVKINTDLINDIGDKVKINTDLIEELFIITNNGFTKVDQCLIALEEGQEDIKLRLNEVAYSFEFKDLSRKVNSLELKVKKLEMQRR